MKAKLAFLFYKLRTGFWFMPTATTIAAIILSQLVLMADRRIPAEWFDGVWGFLSIGTEGARLLVSTIAGSMMTVTSLVFSLTLIALTMTSSQFGPRLLTNFMRDRATQLMLGTFLATFVYALITLGSIHRAGEENVVPYLSITVAMALAIFSFGVLIFFVHHIASAIQADAIIARVSGDLQQAIEQHFGTQSEGTDPASEKAAVPDFDSLDADSEAVRSGGGGYLQAIDHDGLLAVATDNDLVIRLEYRAGHFIVPGQVIARVSPAHRAEAGVVDAVAKAFVVGKTRTMVQDIEFAMTAIVEIALRALSPGINDPYTALACIDHISAGLAEALKRSPPPIALKDDTDAVRLILNPVTFPGLLNTAIDQIRQCAGHNVAVVIRLLEALARIAPFAKTEEQRAAIARQADMIARGSKGQVKESRDLEDITRRLEQLEAIGADG